MVWGWVVVALFTMCVALAMAGKHRVQWCVSVHDVSNVKKKKYLLPILLLEGYIGGQQD
jgi:hypothetical protein